MSQTSKIVLAVIITAIVVGGGIYLWQSQNLEQQNSEVVTDESSTWKTFAINQDGGFSFQHPADWEAIPSSSPEIGSTKVTASSPDWNHLEKGAEFLVDINPPGSGYEYLVKDLGSANIYIGNMLATKNLSSDETGKINAAILKFNKGNNFISSNTNLLRKPMTKKSAILLFWII